MKIEVYTRPGCSFCLAAKRLLDSRSLNYREYDTSREQARLQIMREQAPGRTFPQIRIDGQWIGGFDDLLVFPLNTKPTR